MSKPTVALRVLGMVACTIAAMYFAVAAIGAAVNGNLFGAIADVILAGALYLFGRNVIGQRGSEQ